MKNRKLDELSKLSNLHTPTFQITCDSDNELYIKREDLLPFSFGGNKYRIAIEFIKDMYDNDKDCIVGYGNARSNLSRALANLCYKFEIPCYIISPSDEDGTRVQTFNSRIVENCNATFCYCSKKNVRNTVEEVLTKLKTHGKKPYYIYGNSMGAGNEHIPLKAYRKVYESIKDKYDYIFLATGTGMTQGGLLAGKIVNCGNEKIIGISVSRQAPHEKKVLSNMIMAYNNHVENIPLNEDDIIVDDSYLCNGYGTFSKEIEDVINTQMKINGIPLDPTYTGKAFWGMMDYVRKNEIRGAKILFMHTGGTPLFFDYYGSKDM